MSLFPSNAFMASARSFNMFWCMLQIGINWLKESCVGRLRWNGFKSKLVEDRYIVLCTVTFHYQIAKRNKATKHQKPPDKKQKHKHTQNKQNQKTTNTTEQWCDRFYCSLWVIRINSGIDLPMSHDTKLKPWRGEKRRVRSLTTICPQCPGDFMNFAMGIDPMIQNDTNKY